MAKKFVPLDAFRQSFSFDSSCKLWLPFYKYGGEQAKIYDQSGNNNHGIIAGAVPASYPILSGQELVTNGGFNADSDWVKGTGWSIGTGKATKVAGVVSELEQDVGPVAGHRYKLLYEMTRTAGTLTPKIGGVDGMARSATGTYEDIIVITGTGNLKFQADINFAGTVDNVSVQEVVGYESLGWYFDGVNDSIRIPWSSSLNFGTGSLSFLCWIRPQNLTTVYPRFIYTQKPGTAEGFAIGHETTLNIWADIWTAPVGGWRSASTITANQNYCIGVVFDSVNQKVDFYIDGQLDVSRAVGGWGDLNSGQPFYAGMDAYSTQFYHGTIFEELLLNRALSVQEIRNHYELTRYRYR